MAVYARPMCMVNRSAVSARKSSSPRPFPLLSQIKPRQLASGLLAALVAGLLLGCAQTPPVTEYTPTAPPAPAAEFTLQLIHPRQETSTTTRDFVNILGRTSSDATVRVGDQAASVFATGIFVRDQVPLQPGENRIAITARAADGRQLERVVTVTRGVEPIADFKPSGDALAIKAESSEPAHDVGLIRGDVLALGFRGTPGQVAEYRLGHSDWQPLPEVRDLVSDQPSGQYRANFVVPAGADSPGQPIQFRLRRAEFAPGDSSASGPTVVEATSRGQVSFWDEAALRLVRVTDEGTALSFGLHEVRLGGPYRAELPAGTLLRVVGQRGDNYRIQLAPGMDGWVSRRDVDWAAPGTPQPHLAFTSISIYGETAADQVVIPYGAPVPFAVTPTTSPGGRAAIEVDFFGAHHAATWLSHRHTARVVREVTVQQVAADHVRVRVELHSRQLWGYQWTVTNNALRISVRRPPLLAPPPASPLQGLTIALEAGHGGPNNWGARGVSGSLEKDINRMAVDELARQFEAAGARIVQVREGDTNPTLAERVRRAITANADLFISVHANSAGSERGYLRVSGTSTYYKWPFCRDFSAAIHARLLAHTGLDDFGNVGNFNYYPIRANTWMPSMLVEQAFMSNPADEAKMLDPGFRQQMMRAVVLGAQDWLEQIRAEVGR